MGARSHNDYRIRGSQSKEVITLPLYSEEGEERWWVNHRDKWGDGKKQQGDQKRWQHYRDEGPCWILKATERRKVSHRLRGRRETASKQENCAEVTRRRIDCGLMQNAEVCRRRLEMPSSSWLSVGYFWVRSNPSLQDICRIVLKKNNKQNESSIFPWRVARPKQLKGNWMLFKIFWLLSKVTKYKTNLSSISLLLPFFLTLFCPSLFSQTWEASFLKLDTGQPSPCLNPLLD